MSQRKALVLPESEYICADKDFLLCKGCDLYTYGWEKRELGEFRPKKDIFKYSSLEIEGDKKRGEEIAKTLGYRDIYELITRGQEIQKKYFSRPHKLFKALPPVEVFLTKNFTFVIKESGIVMLFFLEPKGFKYDADWYSKNMEFCVVYLCNTRDGKFKLVAEHNHHDDYTV